jgi:hypothetical protein
MKNQKLKEVLSNFNLPSEEEKNTTDFYDKLVKIKNSNTVRIIICSVATLAAVYIMGHVFKLVGKTVLSYKEMKNAIKQ